MSDENLTFFENFFRDKVVLADHDGSICDTNQVKDELLGEFCRSQLGKTDKDGNLKTKANESILEKRQYFANLLNSQDLAQYQGTIYQVYRALNELETHSFQSARVIKPERNSYKKVKHLFTNKGLATEAIDYLEKVIAGRV